MSVPISDLTTRHKSGLVNPGMVSLGRGGGVFFNPQPYANPPQATPILNDIHTIWDTDKFSVRRSPMRIATLKDTDVFARKNVICVADLPIKFPGTSYRLPIELVQFSEMLTACVSYEHSINKHLSLYYAYLTVDQKFVKSGNYQRGRGLHSDNIQGRRVQPKTYIEHTYFCSDKDPTCFYAQPFDIAGYDVNKYWFNALFEMQADPACRFYCLPNTTYLFDAYSVHAPIPATKDSTRTYVRLTYSMRIFDRAGNTHNSLFYYNWDMKPRPVPQDLIGIRR